MNAGATGTVFSVERFSLHNGPGIRSTLFLKGCPFTCLWCGNPESQLPQPELVYNRDLCIPGCLECLRHCPEGAVEMDAEDRANLRWELLSEAPTETLVACSDACPTGALTVSGERIDAETATDRLLVDRPFYVESGGGVTISGGEPLMQPEFSFRVLKLVKAAGVHTVLDTAGAGTSDDLRRLSSVSDLILYDVKEADPELHRRWVGDDNQGVLDNLHLLLSERRETVVVRFPYIPSLNGTSTRIAAMMELLRSLGVVKMELLPYHRLGVGKYAQLGRRCPLPDLRAPEQSEIDRVVRRFEDSGIRVSIG